MSKLRESRKTQSRLARRVAVFESVNAANRKHEHHRPGSQNPHKQGAPNTKR